MDVLRQDSRKKLLLGQDGNSLVMLIIFIAVVFVILSFVLILYRIDGEGFPEFNAEVLKWATLPATPVAFATKPWTMLTYMFTHIEIWHVLPNLLWLWGYGYILQDLAGNRKIIPIYLYGGVAGALFFLLAINLIPLFRSTMDTVAPLIGSGPALMALAISTTFLSPRYKIFPAINGGIPLWVLTAVFIIISFVGMGKDNVGAAISLVGGGLIGWFFVFQLSKGNDLSAWMNDLADWVDNLFNPEKKLTAAKKLQQQQLYYKATQKPFEKIPHITQQRIDELLDKINQKGYNFLTDEEKEFLKKASKEDI
ncbi:MAG: rhomboid family intrarane serine protease [Segetibacter sp.]|nr:rhomboid family intrarane serine protease [Segetibacter sp.]